MRLVLSCLLLFATASAARADACGDLNVTIRQVNQRYVTSLGELKGLQAALSANPRNNLEAALRSVRRYGQAIRDLKDKRAGIVAIYRSLVEQGCEPFDEKGLAQTRDEFRFYSEEEERIHATAQQLLSGIVTTRSSGLSVDP